MNDNAIVVANCREETSGIQRGAKCYVLQMMGIPDRARISATTRGGRKIKTWIGIKKLSDARVKFMPPEKNLYACYHGRTPERVSEIINAK